MVEEEILPATVAQLVHHLGSALVTGAVGDLSVGFDRVEATDPTFPVQPTAGALLVAPGFRVTDERFEQLMFEAAAAQVAGVVVKAEAAPTAHPSDTAIICIDPSADWAQLLSLLRTAGGLDAESVHPEDSLFGLAEALSSLCGGPVVLHDPAWQLIAYSGDQLLDPVRRDTILGRRAPANALDGLRRIGVLAKLDRGEVVEVGDEEVPGLSRRMAVAVRAGSELLATIWLQVGPDVDVEEIALTLRRAADIAALTLLRHAAAGLAGTLSGDAVFGSLLAGARTERLVAERIGVELDHGFVLAGLRPTTVDEADRAATARRLASLARSYCNSYRLKAQIAVPVDTTYMLFLAGEPDQRQAAVRIVTDMHTRLQPSAPHRAVLSSGFVALGETVSVRKDVDDLLALAERRGWSGLTDNERLHATLRLQHFREVALAHPDLLSGPVMCLANHDRSHGTELVTTLKVYFQSVGNIKETASKLGLHMNTVRYRIAKAQEIAELDLADPDERLLAELQIRLLT